MECIRDCEPRGTYSHPFLIDMHSFYSAILASVLAQNSVAFAHEGATVPFNSVAEYWCSCRTRLDLWEQAIIRLRRAEREKSYEMLEQWWGEHHELLEEVFVTDGLTRLVAASLGEHKIEDRDGNFAPVSDSIFLLHYDMTKEIRRAMLRHLKSRGFPKVRECPFHRKTLATYFRQSAARYEQGILPPPFASSRHPTPRRLLRIEGEPRLPSKFS